jgi:hypothetical protein
MKTQANPRHLAVTLWLLAFLPAPAFTQTAALLDAILDTRQVSYAQAAAVILPAAGLLDPLAGEQEAFARAGFPPRARPENPISLAELSFLAARSFHIPGGFMYALFPGPRYAYRSLAWHRLLPPNPDPSRFLSGEELLYITGLALSRGTEELEAPTPENRLEVKPGQGVSSGPEGILPYGGEFEID